MTITNGSIVWLKTGGPAMTVKRLLANDKNEYLCSWFIGNEVKEYIFSVEQLTTENPNGDSIYAKSNPKRNNSY